MAAHPAAEKVLLKPGAPLVAQLLQECDWATTPLGARETWSSALMTVVEILLASRSPLMLWWGPRALSLYNDACIPILGAKHPSALGQPASSSFSPIWHLLQPLIDTTGSGGPATWNDSIRLEIDRGGALEEAHFTIACSAVPDETAPDSIGGVLATINEITDKVVGERRAATLRDVSSRGSVATNATQACIDVAAAISRHDQDVPFALFYLLTSEKDSLRLAASTGLAQDVLEPLTEIGIRASSVWPIAEVIASGEIEEIGDLERRLTRVPQGPWGDIAQRGAIMAIPSGREGEAVGVLIVGISTRLRFDHTYRDFLELLRTRAAIAIANAAPRTTDTDAAIGFGAHSGMDPPTSAFVSHTSRGLRTPLALLFGPADRAIEKSREISTEPGNFDVTQRGVTRLREFVATLGNLGRRDSALIASEDALKRARASLEEEASALATLNELSSRLWECRSLTEGLEEMLVATMRLMGADLGNIQILDHERNVLAIAAQRGFREDFLEFFKDVRADDDSACGRALRSGARVIIEDVETDPEYAPLCEVARIAGYRSVQSTPLIGHDGKLLGILSTHCAVPHRPSDSTLGRLDLYIRQAVGFIERSAADEAIAERETRFGTMANHAPVMVWVTEADGRCSFASVSWLDFTGQRHDEALGAGWMEAIHPEDRAVVDDMFRSGRNWQQPFRVECRIARHDGAYRWTIVSGAPRFSTGEVFGGYIGSVIDISERKQAEDALRTSEQRYRNIFETAGVSIWEEDLSAIYDELELLKERGVTDFREYFKANPDFVQRALNLIQVRDVNAASLRMFRASHKHQLTTSLARMFTAESALVLAEELVAIAERRPSFESDAAMRTLEGDLLQVFLTIHFPPTRAAFDRVLVTLIDITERKRAEEILLDADRRKDEFLAMLAHELRSPLAPMRNAASILARRDASPEVVRSMSTILDRQIKQMSRLVDDLMDVSRLVQGVIDLNRSTLDVRTVVERVIETLQPALCAKKQSIVTSGLEAPSWVHGDESRLIQIVTNITQNAGKYSPESATIHLSVRAHADEVEIVVRDEGIGIASEALPRVFDLFMQVDRSSKTSQGGLGIGLNIVKRLVELHGGSVCAQSAGLGAGSEFFIRLPRVARTEGQ